MIYGMRWRKCVTNLYRINDQWKEKVLISNRFKLYRELIAQNEINAVIRNKEKVRQATTTSYPYLELLKFNHRNAKSFVFFVTHPKTQCPSPLIPNHPPSQRTAYSHLPRTPIISHESIQPCKHKYISTTQANSASRTKVISHLSPGTLD